MGCHRRQAACRSPHDEALPSVATGGKGGGAGDLGGDSFQLKAASSGPLNLGCERCVGTSARGQKRSGSFGRALALALRPTGTMANPAGAAAVRRRRGPWWQPRPRWQRRGTSLPPLTRSRYTPDPPAGRPAGAADSGLSGKRKAGDGTGGGGGLPTQAVRGRATRLWPAVESHHEHGVGGGGRPTRAVVAAEAAAACHRRPARGGRAGGGGCGGEWRTPPHRRRGGGGASTARRTQGAGWQPPRARPPTRSLATRLSPSPHQACPHSPPPDASCSSRAGWRAWRQPTRDAGRGGAPRGGATTGVARLYSTSRTPALPAPVCTPSICPWRRDKDCQRPTTRTPCHAPPPAPPSA